MPLKRKWYFALVQANSKKEAFDKVFRFFMDVPVGKDEEFEGFDLAHHEIMPEPANFREYLIKRAVKIQALLDDLREVYALKYDKAKREVFKDLKFVQNILEAMRRGSLNRLIEIMRDKMSQIEKLQGMAGSSFCRDMPFYNVTYGNYFLPDLNIQENADIWYAVCFTAKYSS